MVTFIPFNLTSAKAVIDEVWDRGVREAMVFGVQEDDIIKYIESRGNDPYCYIAVADDKPFAVFGAYEIEPHVCRTWFMATEDFQQHFVELTRKLKKIIEENSKRDGVKLIETLSACDHPKTAKWFKILGLKPEGCYAFGTGITRYIKKVN